MEEEKKPSKHFLKVEAATAKKNDKRFKKHLAGKSKVILANLKETNFRKKVEDKRVRKFLKNQENPAPKKVNKHRAKKIAQAEKLRLKRKARDLKFELNNK